MPAPPGRAVAAFVVVCAVALVVIMPPPASKSRTTSGSAALPIAVVTVAPAAAGSPATAGRDLAARERLEIRAEGEQQRVRTLIEALGGFVELESGGRIQAVVPTSAKPVLIELLGAARLETPVLVVPLQASQLSRSLLGVDRWREAGFTGHGVRLAVLDGGFGGYESRLGSTLPAQVVARSFRAGVEVGAGTDHGTRAAEVAYSIAPGARIYLVSFGTMTEFSAAVDFLVEEQVEVVSFSLGFLHSGPGNGRGPVNEIVERGVSGGAVWSVAAGNWAREHWRGPYVDSNADSIHEFALGLTGNGRFYQGGDLISVSLRWDDRWGVACSDFDLELFAPSGSLVRASRRTQACSGDPVEGFQVLATETGIYTVRIVGADVRSDHTLDLLMVGSPDRGEELELVTPQWSLSEPADNASVVTVGALSAGAPLGAAPFSSRGPTADGRPKPEVLSPTGGAALAGSGFAGTSAAAPHVAGALALLREGFPGAAANAITRELLLRSIELGRGTAGAPEVLASLGSVGGLGPLLPAGAAQSRWIGTPQRGGLALLVYVGVGAYPTRFAHLLTPGRTPLAYFRFDQATQTFDRYIVGAPSQVQTFATLQSGTVYVVRFAE